MRYPNKTRHKICYLGVNGIHSSIMVIYTGYTEGVAVPPPPTPVLPVFRGPVGVAGAGAGPSFQPGPSLVTVVEGGTAFLQCALRQRTVARPVIFILILPFTMLVW